MKKKHPSRRRDDAERQLSRPELIAAARSFAAAARSPKTVREYRRDWLQFCAFCDKHDALAMPATAKTIALYVADLAGRGRKPSTITRALAAISQAHKSAKHPSPTSSDDVATVLAGIKRKVGTKRTKKAPILLADLRALVKTQPSDTLLGLRNRALFVIGFSGAFRRSELVALDVSDVAFTREGIQVGIRRSKTDQEGAGQTIGLPFGSNPITCPVRTLRAWLEQARIEDGPIFRACTRKGKMRGRLRDVEVARVLKRAALAAGLDGSTIAGHSLRRGFITVAARAGKSERDIMRQSRHKSAASLREYIEEAGLFDDNPASGIGL
ncbi:MAG: tyrosine-type recombinase/integrase [Deltaproteobacteria bacterium]|nr:tyrosine-type recombinase/integrase [Deltaproteobacteria bacterium]